MKINALKLNNIKKIEALDLEFDENQNTYIISGKNGQGKSTVLDSIFWALGGKEAIQSRNPIREGQKEGEVQVTIDDFIVTRKFTEKNSYVSVTSKNGEKHSGPQKMLDDLISKLSFDPLEFMNMDPKKQRKVLMDLTGLNFDEIDGEINQVYENRKEIGRDLKNIQGQVEGYELTENPGEYKDIQELTRKYQEVSENNQQIERQKNKKADLENKKAELEKQLESVKFEIEQVDFELSEKEYKDLESISEELQNAEEHNRKVREYEEYMQLVEKGKAKKEEYQVYTNKIQELQNSKKEQLENAQMPIAGLEIESDGVTYSGVYFEDLSHAEQIRVSTAIVMALNPELKIIMTKDGSMLDSESMKVIEDTVQSNDYQMLIEQVDESGEIGVYIEDGKIKKNNYNK